MVGVIEKFGVNVERKRIKGRKKEIKGVSEDHQEG